MGRSRDEFWDHAEKLKGGKRFRCNYCECEYGGGATRIKSHLSQLKGNDIQICSKVPEHVRLAAVRAIDPHDHDCFSNKKRKKKSNIASSSSSSQTEMGVNKRKATTNYGRPDDDQIVVDTKLAKFMHLHNIPFDVVDELVKCVADFRCNHQQLSAHATLRRQLEYDVPKEVEEYTKHAEESLLQTASTLVFYPFNGLLYAWTSNGLLFKGTLPYDDDDDQKWLSSKVQSLGPNNILQLLIHEDYKVGNQYYWERAKKALIDYPRVCVTFCATQQILSFFWNISSDRCFLIICASLVFMFMKKNHIILKSDLYSNAQSPSIVGLAYDHLTKYGEELSFFVVGFMRLKSLLEYEDILQALPLPPQLSNDSKHSRTFYHVIKQKKFWKRGKEVVFEAYCLLISNNNVTVGYLYQLMERAKNLIDGHENCCFKDCIRTHFNKMYKRIIGPMHAAAALLNPAYLCSGEFKEDNNDMKQGIDFVLENIVQVEERDDFMTQLLTYTSKDPNLFTPSALTLLNTSHPGVWWEFCGYCVPVVKKYALKIVTQPCSNYFFSEEEMELITRDKSNSQLKTKIMMMNKSVAPKPVPHPVEANKLVEQLAALLDMEPSHSKYDLFIQKLLDCFNHAFWEFS